MQTTFCCHGTVCSDNNGEPNPIHFKDVYCSLVKHIYMIRKYTVSILYYVTSLFFKKDNIFSLHKSRNKLVFVFLYSPPPPPLHSPD